MCETSYTEKMQNMHNSMEEKAAVDVSARVRARLLDAMRMHYQKAQVMTVMRSFAKWRETVVLDKSNKMFLEVIVSSRHISLYLISSHFSLSFVVCRLSFVFCLCLCLCLCLRLCFSLCLSFSLSLCLLS